MEGAQESEQLTVDVEETKNSTAVENEEYETVKLEPCAAESSETEEQKEAWTTYEIAKQEKKEVPESPNVSEITPEDEEEVEFMDASGPLRIIVANPKKEEEISKLGMRGSFTSYCVQTETKLVEFGFTKRAVWRRFRDFESLYNLIHENHRGYVIPPLPSKNFLEAKRGKETFIRERQMELNKFLCQVALHPHLYKTEEFKVFLGCPEDLSSSQEWYKLTAKAKKAAGNGENLVDLDRPGETMKKEITTFFKKVGSTFRKDGLNSTHSITETERELQDMVPKMKQLELLLVEAVEKSHQFGNLFYGLGEEFGHLGRIWVTISRFEEDYMDPSTLDTNPTLQMAKVLQRSGYACVRVQQITTKSTTVLRARMNCLADDLATLPPILLSLHDRTLALRSVYETQGRLENARKNLDNLTVESSKKLGGTSGFAAKSTALTQDIKDLVEETNRQSENYDVVTNRNLTELERIRQTRNQNLNQLALNVARAQQEYYETIALVWVNLADEITTLLDKQTDKSFSQ